MFTEQVLSKELESTAVVRFQDCDPFQHLNNARYIDYFMNAREDQLKEFYNFSIFAYTQEHGQGWVVTKTQIAYLSPAIMQESVIIRTRLIRMSENQLVIEGLMLDQAGRRLKSVSWVEFTFVSLQTGRPAQHSDDLMSLFRSVVVEDVYTPDGFNPRVSGLKDHFRKPVAEQPA